MRKYLISIIVLIVLILAACEETGTPTDSPAVMMTSAVGSMVASFFSTQTAMATPPAPAQVRPGPATSTFLPTPTFIISTPTFATFTPAYYSATPTKGTVTPTGTLQTTTPDPASLAVGCNNLAFVRDVTVPSGTVMARGQMFRKTWKVQNTGTCDWAFNYILVHTGGDLLSGETGRTQKRVPVWSWAEVSVDMNAPQTPGKYSSSWRLSDGKGGMFGATLTVSIVVKDPDPTAAPTNTSVPPTQTPVPPTATTDPAYP
jgi:hypothetical protein